MPENNNGWIIGLGVLVVFLFLNQPSKGEKGFFAGLLGK